MVLNRARTELNTIEHLLSTSNSSLHFCLRSSYDTKYSAGKELNYYIQGRYLSDRVSAKY